LGLFLFFRTFAIKFVIVMKNLALFFLALLAFVACSQEQKSPFSYRGLAFTLSTSQFVDSMQARGFAVDSAASDSGRTVVLSSEAVKYRVLAAYQGEQLQVVQETYNLSTNDSTRRMWQELRDGLEQELGAWPDCPLLSDDHKVANFDAGDGLISVLLENTYPPTLTVRYTRKAEQK
jgi:hypothetical protein